MNKAKRLIEYGLVGFFWPEMEKNMLVHGCFLFLGHKEGYVLHSQSCWGGI